MKKSKQQFVVREAKQIEFEFPQYLKTTWTSNDSEKFNTITDILKRAFYTKTANDIEEKDEVIIGTKSVLKRISANGMSLLCVIACVDNGGNIGLMSRLAQSCYLNGVPLILGRDPRQLGSAFNKKRVCCLGLTRQAAAKAELFDLIVNLSAVSSQVQGPLDEFVDIKERFQSACERISGGIKASNTKRHHSNSNDQKQVTPNVKNNATPQSQKKKQKTQGSQMKGNFFTSFD